MQTEVLSFQYFLILSNELVIWLFQKRNLPVDEAKSALCDMQVMLFAYLYFFSINTTGIREWKEPYVLLQYQYIFLTGQFFLALHSLELLDWWNAAQ